MPETHYTFLNSALLSLHSLQLDEVLAKDLNEPQWKQMINDRNDHKE